MTPEERWEQATPAELLAMSLHSERGPMVVDDLRRLPRSPSVLAEGSALPAGAVSSGLVDRSRAVWLIPTPESRAARLADRGVKGRQLELYALLAETIEREANRHCVPTLTVDRAQPIDELVAALEELLREALANAPRAVTVEERRALLREANEAVAAQVRAYHARPWAEGDAETTVRDFVCECGDRDCTALIRTEILSLAVGPLLAAGHA